MEAVLDTEAERTLDRRKNIGEVCLTAAWGTGMVIEGDDRESAAKDAISDILTALYGPAGVCRPTQDGDGWTLDYDGEAHGEARELLDAALRSYEGDAEDYTVEEES